MENLQVIIGFTTADFIRWFDRMYAHKVHKPQNKTKYARKKKRK